MIYGNMIGGSGSGFGKTFIIEDETGNQFTGVVVDELTVFTATDNDVRAGSVYAGNNGVSTGTKDIPSYHTRCGRKFILAGKQATLAIPEYDYTDLIITISTYDTSVDQSVVVTYVSIDNGIYVTGNNIKLSDIIIDTDSGLIDFGITVNEKSVLRYYVTKEEY